MSRTRWTGRVVTDVIGNAGSVVLSDESTAQRDLEDWLHDYYEIDDDEAESLSENLTASVITGEAREYVAGLFGLEVAFDSEWSAERSAEAVFEYMQGRGEGWISDEADVEIAAEYLYAAAHEN